MGGSRLIEVVATAGLTVNTQDKAIVDLISILEILNFPLLSFVECSMWSFHLLYWKLFKVLFYSRVTVMRKWFKHGITCLDKQAFSA